MAQIRLNEDTRVVEEIRTGLAKRGGHCPCMLEQNDDTLCMCKDFREKIRDPHFYGYCHCMLYYKEKETT